jgi:cyanophycin synthetase
VDFHVENTLAAVAAALALKVPLDVLRARAESFTSDWEKVPARFNVIDVHGATVVVDYGHNCDALAALIKAIEKFPGQRRTCVYTTAGDRRDCDMVRQGELIGRAFDRVILYEDHYLRGRPQGQIIGLIRQGVEAGGRAKQIDEVRGADAAVELALRSVQPGDVLLVQADTVDESVQFIRSYLESLAEGTSDEEEILEAPKQEGVPVPVVAPRVLAATPVAKV